MSLPHDQFQVLDALLLAALHVVEPHEPADEERQAAYHVVPGKIDAKELKREIRAGGGTATLKTVNGEPLTATMDGDDIVLKDAKGGTTHITIANVYQSNGVLSVLLSGRRFAASRYAARLQIGRAHV